MSEMYTDEDIDDLVRINIELTKENNKMLKAMRRSHRWSVFFKFVWLVVLVGAPVVVYYLYLQPYVEEAQALYFEVQQNLEQMRQVQENFQASVGDATSRFGDLLRRE